MPPAFMSRDEVRRVDRIAIEKYGLPGIVLMENAARGCGDWLRELGINGPVVICAGHGNNGGDGFAIARHLENSGCDVRVLLFAAPSTVTGDAGLNLNVLQKAGTSLRCFEPGHLDRDTLRAELRRADWVIDALLGTGTRGALRDPCASVIPEINASTGRILAVDLPSGLDCDTGRPVDDSHPVAVHADFTATFVAQKSGFRNAASRQYTGTIRTIDIGVPCSMFQE